MGSSIRFSVLSSQTSKYAGWKILGTVNEIVVINRVQSRKICRNSVFREMVRSQFQNYFPPLSLLPRQMVNSGSWLSLLVFSCPYFPFLSKKLLVSFSWLGVHTGACEKRTMHCDVLRINVMVRRAIWFFGYRWEWHGHCGYLQFLS